MVQSAKTFRIFVSSTFSDLKEERNTLQKEVFPKLRELCAQHGFKFQAIDLRWGVSEEAGLDQQTMKICLEEIERSQRISPKPNFIVLLGNRYGWRPLPAEIEVEEFNEILNKVSADEKECLLWKEEQAEDKKGWYRLDENTVPAVYCLQPRTGDYVDYEKWTLVEQKLHSILLNATSKLNLEEDDFLKYYASATEQEIVHGALKVEDAKDHVFCFFRNIENLPDDKDFVDLDQYGNVDEDAQEKLENLKQKLREQLPESHIKEYGAEWTDDGVSNDHLKDLCEDVYKALENIILEKIEEIEDIEPLDQEIEAHEEFGNDRAKFFTGRTEILKDISKYLENGNNSPLAIYGESGSGKSALLAKAVIDAEEEYQNADVVSRFIGVTPDSSDIRSLLESLCHQISRIYGKSDSEVPSEYNDLVSEFSERLKFATENKPLFIFLDALDQLSGADNAHSLNWLPDNLSDNVRIVVSSLEENFYEILKNKIPKDNLLKLEKLNKEEGENLLKLWLKDGKRTLQSKQWNEVINKFQIEGLPLYLKLAFDEVKNWKSYTTPELRSDIPGIIKQIFNRLSVDSNHGKLIVDRSLGYLAASKNGLSEDEIIDILSRDKAVFYDFIYRARSEPTEILNAVMEVLTEDEDELGDSWALFEKLQKDKEFCFDVFDRLDKSKISFKLPIAIWSRLYFDIEPYLTERSADETSLLAFYHRQLGEVVAEEFLKYNAKIEKHRALAEYFLDQDLKTENASERVYNVRRVSELPYQETYGELWDELEETLCDLRFIEAKCAVEMTYNLIKDYNLALDLHPVAQEENQKKLEHEKLVEKYVKDLIAYSEGEIEHLNTIHSVELWSQEKINRDRERFISNPNSLDNIKAFYQFVSSESSTFAEFGELTGFCLQQAYNSAKSGPVAEKAKQILNDEQIGNLILKNENSLPKYTTITHPAQLKIMEGHITQINSAAITINGKKAISGSSDKTVRVWDLETGEQLHRLEGHNNEVNAVAVTADSKKAITGSYDDSIIIWDLETGKILKKIEETGKINSMKITPDGKKAVSGSKDGSLCIWDLKTGKGKRIKEEFNDEINAVAISICGKKIISGVRADIIEFWDFQTGKLLKTLKGHTDRIIAIAITPDGKKAVSGSKDGSLRVWDLKTGKCIKIIKCHVNGVAITPDGKKTISISEDGYLRVWDSKTGKCLKTIELWQILKIPMPMPKPNLDPYEVELILDITSDGKKAISGSGTSNDSNFLLLWNLENGEVQQLEGHTKIVNGVVFTSDGKKAVSGSKDGSLRIWDLKTGKQLQALEGHTDEVCGVAVTLDGKRIISGSSDKTVRIWDLKTGKCLNILKHSYPIDYVSIASDEKTIISGGLYDKKVQTWDLETGACLKTINGPGYLSSVAISADGKKAISRNTSQILILWNFETGEYIKRIKGPVDVITSIDVSLNGKKAITGSMNGSLLVWNLENGEISEIMRSNSIIRSVAITSDGNKAISGSESKDDEKDNTVSVWDLEAGELLKIFKGHINRVDALSITPDGKKAVSGSYDETLRLWDLEKGETQKIIEKHIDSVRIMDVTPDGKKVIILRNGLENDKTLYVLEQGTEKCIKKLEWQSPFINFCITPDSRKLISVSEDTIFLVWDLEIGKILQTLEGHRGYLNALAITPDSKKAITGSVDDSILIWDLETGKILKKIEETGPIISMKITPDGKKAVSGNIDRSLRIWDLKTGKCLKILNDHSYDSIFFITKDGKKIVYMDKNDSPIYVFDLNTGNLLKTIERDKHLPYNDFIITPDGKKIILQSFDYLFYNYENGTNLIDLIDLDNGNYQRKIEGPIYIMGITRDGKKAVSSFMSDIWIWDLETEKIICVTKENSPIYLLNIKANGHLTYITRENNIISSYLTNMPILPLITATRIWLSGGKNNSDHWDNDVTSNCEFCGKHFKVQNNMLNIIRELEEKYTKSNGWIADEAWEDPRLISECPYCHEKLKFNPFIVDNSNEELEDVENLDNLEEIDIQNDEIDVESKYGIHEEFEESVDTQFKEESEKSQIKEKPKKSWWKFWK